MLTKLVLVVVLISCVSLSQCNSQMVVGSKCRIPNSGISGECKLLMDCPKAIEDIRNNSTLPLNCGFSGFDPIICCAIQIEATVPPSVLKRVEKCNEYAKSVYEERHIALLVPSNKSTQNIKVDTCVINSIPLIVGGSQARSGEFPHFALLGYNDTDTGDIGWHCGGSLVSSRFVLTAAHCLSPRLGHLQIVRLGDITANQFLTEILVHQIIPHPDFTAKKLYNDIGLIKMTEKVQFSKFIRPICLPTTDQFPSKLIEAGWEFPSVLSNEKDRLLREIVNIITNEECNSYFQPVNRKLRDGIFDTQLCTSFNINSNFCKGDMLQMYNPDSYCMYTQIGVASFGSSCIQGSTIYTRVFKYSDWIEKNIWGPGEDD